MSLALRELKTSDVGFAAQLATLLAYSPDVDAEVEASVGRILADVRTRGDAAVLDATRRYDRVDAASVAALEIARGELRAAADALPATQRDALEKAAARIRSFHERQLAEGGHSWSHRDGDGSLLGQKVTPLDRVGIYVPGGKAAYPSSVLMSAVPAKVAGVGEIVMVAPMPNGERNPLVLAAAAIAGVDRVFAIGGAQAIGALAYGTATVPAVHKITGPGNAYVAAAKRQVFGTVGIDMIAGPSEILVLADGTTPPDWVAMDLFSQAEHDELAQSILLCPDAAYIARVKEAIERLLPTLPRQQVIRASLEGRGALIQTRSMEEACEISNRIAPEHLEVSADDPHRWEPLLRHAGAIFLGAFTSESLGDYCAGPNHVLPTSGTARFSSPLGVFDFQKRSSLIEVSERGARALGPIASELARGEGLTAHARAAEMRLDGAAPADRAIASTDERIAAVIRQDVKSMHAYAIQQSAGLVKLDAMENPFRLPERLQDELGRRLGRVAINRYPTSCVDDVVAALSRYVELPPGCKLMLGNGSDELISLLALACDLPGATIIAPVPGFVMYEMSARLQGLRFVGVPLRARFELDEAAMLAAVEAHRPAITYIAYPNNPTANLFDEAAVERVVAAIGKQSGLVVLDEAYQPFSSRSWMSRVGTLPHVLVMRTLSKFGLAGVRLGYLAGPAALVDEIDKVRPPYNIGALNAEATLFALEHADEFARQAALLRGERERLQRALRELPGVEPFPSEANMILVRVGDGASVFAGMRQRGVLVKNVAGLHSSLANCLRLTVGTPEENTLMLEALRASLP